MEKNIILFMILFLLIPIISAAEFEISLTPHYFKEGKEVLIYNNETKFDGISFDIIGKNFNQNSRMLNLTVIDSYPVPFKEAIPKKIIEMLRIKQEKILWVSEIIDINELNLDNLSFWVGVEATHEKTQELFYNEGHYQIDLNSPTPNVNFLQKIGEFIWEDNPFVGLFVLFAVIVIISFYGWKYKFSDKLEKYRVKSEARRIEARKYNEGWK